jgi:hypothetical protein
MNLYLGLLRARRLTEYWRKLPLTAEEFQKIESNVAPYLSPAR